MKYMKTKEMAAIKRLRELNEAAEPHPESARAEAIRNLVGVLLELGCDKLVEEFVRLEQRG